MATIPVPATFTAGTKPTEENFNSLRDGINFLLGVPVAAVYNSGLISIATGASGSPLTWDSEEFDNDGVHSNTTNNDRLTIVTPGVYVANLGVVSQASTSAISFFDMRINANISGTNRILNRDSRAWLASSTEPGFAATITSKLVRLSAGDYVYASARHGGAGTVSVTGGQHGGTNLSLRFVGA